MAEEKQILKSSEKLVESETPPEPSSLIVALETTESERTESESKTEQVETSQESQPAKQLEPVPEIQTPIAFLKSSAMPALKFVLIPLVCVFLSDLIFPMFTKWILDNSYVRTAVLCAFIWNLIGAVLYARAREGRHIIIWYFAVPLATVYIWAIPLHTIVSVLSYWLPPNLR